MISSCIYKTPIADLHLVADNKSLLRADWARGENANDKSDILQETAKQLDEYFAGKRKVFDLPLTPEGTEFQLQAWEVLRKIPYAQTLSYGDQAMQMQNPKAVRAVGAANGRNPISIIVPCHRVVGANGKLTGYAGGLDVKEFLLEHEAKFA